MSVRKEGILKTEGKIKEKTKGELEKDIKLDSVTK